MSLFCYGCVLICLGSAVYCAKSLKDYYKEQVMSKPMDIKKVSREARERKCSLLY